MVPAAEQKQVDRGVLANRVQQRLPLGVVEVGALVQSVYGREDDTVCGVGPAGVCWVPGGQRGDLFAGQAGLFGVDSDVDTPLVSCAAECGGAVDRQLAVP